MSDVHSSRACGSKPGMQELHCWFKVNGTHRQLACGEVLFAPGQAAESLFLVMSGRVGFFLSSEAEGQELLDQAGPGELVLDIALVDGGGVVVEALAQEESHLVEMGSGGISGLERENPALFLHLQDMIARLLVRWLRRMEELHRGVIRKALEQAGLRGMGVEQSFWDGFGVEVSLTVGPRVRGKLLGRSGSYLAMMEKGGKLIWIPLPRVAELRPRA
jgi:CRP-like cAMP-binding protein